LAKKIQADSPVGPGGPDAPEPEKEQQRRVDMATSRCPCGSTNFELKEVVPKGSSFKLNFVQCASCGTPISTIEYMNISDMLQK
jgi:hypothetical protein